MDYTNTLGLTITRSTQIRKRRLLPLPGDVLVREGDTVTPNTIVAYAEIPGKPIMLTAAARLQIEPHDLPKYMLKQVGDIVQSGERIALYRSFLGLTDAEVKSPTDGTIESISTHTGIVTVRTPTVPVELRAYLAGRVVEIIEHEGVTIENTASLIEGVFGIGGERHGILHLAVSGPDDVLDADHITPEMQNMIIVGGSLITREALLKAVQVGVAGIVVGGVDDEDLSSFLGYEIGLAVTGDERRVTMVLTEGFGHIPMAAKTYDLIKSLDGKAASINGRTQIRTGVLRPELIIPCIDPCADSRDASSGVSGQIGAGSSVRIVREPYMGRLAQVIKLPSEPQTVPSGITTPVALVELDDGTTQFIPLVNLELTD